MSETRLRHLKILAIAAPILSFGSSFLVLPVGRSEDGLLHQVLNLVILLSFWLMVITWLVCWIVALRNFGDATLARRVGLWSLALSGTVGAGVLAFSEATRLGIILFVLSALLLAAIGFSGWWERRRLNRI